MISLVIPTLNEVDNVEPLLSRIAQCRPTPNQIIFVDDGSEDGTRERLRSEQVEVIERVHPSLGLAGAVLAGARAATSEWLVVMDADLSHPPERIGDLLQPLFDGRADMVIGSRYVKGSSTPGWPLWRKVMSRVAAGLAYPLTGVHDSMSGFFAMPTRLLLETAPAATGFKIAFEVLVQSGKNLRVLELPIVFSNRTRGTSKMSFGVASLFACRWLAATAKSLFQRRSVAASPASARFIRQSSNPNPVKSSKVAQSALP
jgi:dolichol-phosphate mannosyltransferase